LLKTALGETSNVDDHVEWLETVTFCTLYLKTRSDRVPARFANRITNMDFWELSTKPGVTRHVFLKEAFSPAVVTAVDNFHLPLMAPYV